MDFVWLIVGYGLAATGLWAIVANMHRIMDAEASYERPPEKVETRLAA